jgi:hypothetical protein
LLCWVGINFYNMILVLVLRSKADFLLVRDKYISTILRTSLGNTLGTYWEPDGNPLRIWREHVGNTKEKWKKILMQKVTLADCDIN